MVDTTRETIELASATAAGADEMAVLISNSEPRFTFFRYQHEHEANIQSSIVFVYTCPTASVKERMLYASSKAGIIETAARDADLILAKKVGLYVLARNRNADKRSSLKFPCPPRFPQTCSMRNSIPRLNAKLALPDQRDPGEPRPSYLIGYTTILQRVVASRLPALALSNPL